MIYIICGMPGAGKTTYAKKLEQETGALRLSLDEMVHKNYGENHECALEIREYATKYLALQKITKELRSGNSLILDYGFFKQHERDWYRTLAQDYGVNSEVHYISAPYEKRLKRVLERNKTLDNIHHIDEKVLRYLGTLFEEPNDVDMKTIQT